MNIIVEPTRATYCVADMAVILGISEQVVRQHLRAGLMPGKRIGGIWLVHRPAFDRWVVDEFSGPHSAPSDQS